MRLIIDIDEEIYKGLKEYFDDGNDGLKSELAIANGIPLDDKTNGEIILKLFTNNDLYNLSIGRKNIYYFCYPDVEIKCGIEWWDSLYKENK